MNSQDLDVMYVQNPALGAVLLWRFTCGYYSNENRPVPFPLLFVVLPIVFRQDLCKNAVRKIFESLSVFVKDAGFEIQIIVTEHADDDIWGNIPDSRIHLVEKWRNNIKLVPVEWLA